MEVFRDLILPVAILMAGIVALWRERVDAKKEAAKKEEQHETEVTALRAEIKRLNDERLDQETTRGAFVSEALLTLTQTVRDVTAALRAIRQDKERRDEQS